MSRQFDGVDDVYTYAAPGSTNLWTFGTLGCLIKITTTTDGSWQSWIEGEKTDGTIHFAIGRRSTGNVYLATASLVDGTAVQDGDGWMWIFVTKATGSVAATVHKIPVGGSRTSTAMGSAQANGFTIPSGRIKLGGDDDFANMLVANAFALQGLVLTTTQIDGVVTANSTAALLALVSTPADSWVVDDSDGLVSNLANPGTYDRTAAVGTTSSADDPSGYTYGAGGAAATSLPPVQPYRQLAGVYSR